MAKLRKMLGDINSQESIDLMKTIETQNHYTLSSWAIHYAKERYLEIYYQHSDDRFMDELIDVCLDYLEQKRALKEVKEICKNSRKYISSIKDEIALASSRAILTACSSIMTPTNCYGFVLYGSAAMAYHQVGLKQSQEIYDNLALQEMKHALDSLKAIAIENEENPVKVNWNC